MGENHSNENIGAHITNCMASRSRRP